MYSSIMQRFPNSIQYAFAYGSAVKHQLGYQITSKNSKMIDFILCVNNPTKWHKENLNRNGTDYSALRLLGYESISNYQQNFGAKVYFNTLVPLSKEGTLLKYGVISHQHLMEDLLEWRFLYIAGRLHKPVVDLITPNSTDLTVAIDQNLRCAVRAALLILPERFTDFELFHTIANLSYGGDFRMKFGENKQKVRNIVEPQIEDFYKLYLPAIRDFSQFVSVLSNKQMFEQVRTPCSIEHHIRNLPRELLNRILINSRVKNLHSDDFRRIIYKNYYQHIILKSLNQIVWRSSIIQSLKNIPCAGISKSIEYSLRKLSKMFYSI